MIIVCHNTIYNIPYALKRK